MKRNKASEPYELSHTGLRLVKRSMILVTTIFRSFWRAAQFRRKQLGWLTILNYEQHAKISCEIIGGISLVTNAFRRLPAVVQR